MKKKLQEMVIRDKWFSYKDDVGKTKFVDDTLLDDYWWDKTYLFSFTSPIFDLLST